MVWLRSWCFLLRCQDLAPQRCHLNLLLVLRGEFCRFVWYIISRENVLLRQSVFACRAIPARLLRTLWPRLSPKQGLKVVTLMRSPMLPHVKLGKRLLRPGRKLEDRFSWRGMARRSPAPGMSDRSLRPLDKNICSFPHAVRSCCWLLTCRASAEAQAQIFGKAIAGAVADAVNGKNFAGSAVRAEEVAAAIVRATANVEVKLSTTQGFAKATSEATARVVATVVVEAIGEAVAFTVNNRAETGAGAVADVQVDTKQDDANANTNVDVSGDSSADADANAETFAQSWPVCSGDAASCCGVQNDSFCGNYSRNNIGSVKGWRENGSNQSCKC
ncbi:hypothetical protein BSKO_05538 [Bryopsis sp. KO-2023]|nr:hypothetical protein BSKO_05538 [Bryopsis sp. KO-2023]